MKSIKSVLAASLLAAGIAQTASANTLSVIYLAGAPAYRQNSNDTITALVGGFAGSGLTATSANGTTATKVESANQNQWYIQNYVSGVDLEINANWSGSTAGIESITSGTVTQAYIPDSNATVANILAPLSSVAVTEAHQPQASLSDTFQTTTPFSGTVQLEEGASAGNFVTASFATVTPTKLGVEPYIFVASPGATAAGLTNITTAQAQLLYKNGKLPLAFFTGNSADEHKLVYGLTRDPGSGARLIAVAETGIGTTTPILTYKPTVSGGSTDTGGNTYGGTISTPINLYSAGEIPSTGLYDENDGDTGYSSFGPLLTAITSTPPTGTLFVTYFNLSDGATAVADGATQLTYNGITESAASVEDGLYTFWSFELLYKATSGIGTNQASFLTSLASAFPSHAALATTLLHVNRTVDGAPPTATYTP